MLGELVQTTDGKWMTRLPARCPHGHTLGAGQVLMGHQACLGHGGGHTTWTCCTCDQTVSGPPLNPTPRRSPGLRQYAFQLDATRSHRWQGPVVFGQQPKPGPGVQAWAVGPGSGGIPLPGMGGDQRGQCIDADRSGAGGYGPVGRNGQHIAQSVAADRGAQPRIGTVDFVAGHPGGGNLGLYGAVDQCRGQGGLGRETSPIRGDSSTATTIRILRPRSR